MRHRRKSIGLVAAVCAFALAATPALAHEFTASKAGKITGKVDEGKTREIGPNTAALKFGPFKIKCNKTVAKGTVAAGSSKTFATSIKMSRCWTEVKFGAKEAGVATRFTAPLAIEYHANGFVESGGELEEVEGAAVLAGGSAEIKVNTGLTNEFEKSRCNITWPEQTLPLKAEKKPEGEYSAVTFSNVETPSTKLKKFPDGFQHSISVSNSIKGIKYEFEGEPCEEWGREEGSEGGGGTYFGSFPQVLAGGNFEFS